MTPISSTDSEEDIISRAKAAFEANYERICGYANYQHRRLRGEMREEAVAETLGWSWKIFRNQALAGEDPLESLSATVRFAAGHVRAGKLLGRNESRHPPMISLSGEEGARDVPYRGADPAEEAAAELDYQDWLHALSERQRLVAEDLVQGYAVPEIAQRHGGSRQAVSQAVERIRQSYADRER